MAGWHHRWNGHEHGKTSEMVGDREAWHAAVHRVAKSWTRLGNWTTTTATTIYIYNLFHFLFRYDLLQGIEYSSLCYRVGLVYPFYIAEFPSANHPKPPVLPSLMLLSLGKLVSGTYSRILTSVAHPPSWYSWPPTPGVRNTSLFSLVLCLPPCLILNSIPSMWAYLGLSTWLPALDSIWTPALVADSWIWQRILAYMPTSLYSLVSFGPRSLLFSLEPETRLQYASPLSCLSSERF